MRGAEWDLPPILVEIVTTGLRRIEGLGQRGEAARCAIEADHLQSLPGLLLDFDPDIFDRYVNIERVAFIEKSSPDEVAEFAAAWARLANVVQACKDEHMPGKA